jgi:hypothetical protein
MSISLAEDLKFQFILYFIYTYVYIFCAGTLGGDADLQGMLIQEHWGI